MPNQIITSPHNERFKSLQSLREKKAREATGTFLVEGQKEIGLALKNGFQVDEIWAIEGKFPSLEGWLAKASQGGCFSIPESLFNKIGYREKTEGIIAVVAQKPATLDTLTINPTKPSLVIVADQLEKPGNIGTLFRIADGVGADAVILAGSSTDAYNPNVIRNSVGTFFTVPFAVAEPADVVAWLSVNNLSVVVASPEAKQLYHEIDWPKRTALVVGREHEGVQSDWGKTAIRVNIPMRGQNDSLNVAVSTGILVYEWAKQRI